MYASLSFHYQVLLLLAILFLQGVDTQRVLCRKMSLSLPRIENSLNSFLCIVYFLYLICMLFLYLHFVCIWNCHSLLNMYKAAVTENITSNCLYQYYSVLQNNLNHFTISTLIWDGITCYDNSDDTPWLRATFYGQCDLHHFKFTMFLRPVLFNLVQLLYVFQSMQLCKATFLLHADSHKATIIALTVTCTGIYSLQ